MNLEEALSMVREGGASHALKMSDHWYFVYRINEGRRQARSLNRRGASWEIGTHLVSGNTFYAPDGWNEVEQIPERARPIGEVLAQVSVEGG